MQTQHLYVKYKDENASVKFEDENADHHLDFLATHASGGHLVVILSTVGVVVSALFQQFPHRLVAIEENVDVSFGATLKRSHCNFRANDDRNYCGISDRLNFSMRQKVGFLFLVEGRLAFCLPASKPSSRFAFAR